MLHKFIVYVEDKPGVLNRVSSLLRRRSYNIESLAVGHTDKAGVSRMTFTVDTDELTSFRIEANLYKLVNVLRVERITDEPAVERELTLIKVRANDQSRPSILQIVDVFRGRVVDVANESLIVELTGTQDKIEGMLEMLRTHGIVEMVRTGTIVMGRGPDAPAISPEFVQARVPEESTAR
ncbi:MAG: acetolactate synthase small subunit [Anaerolineae bacterium]|nr:acetolactate synthase small subunit [Anaerolineae bacterium]